MPGASPGRRRLRPLGGAHDGAPQGSGHFVVDGQKVWSSFAHIADWCILVTRSDPRRAPRGLTYLLVDMHAPGVEVRPLRQITGEAEFNEIFFTGVEVPAENVVGEVGGGWQVAMTTLLHERGTPASPSPPPGGQIQKLIALAKERGATAAARRDRARVDRPPGRPLHELPLADDADEDRDPRAGGLGREALVVGGEPAVTKLALELLGPEAQILENGNWQHQQLRSRGNTIEAGTSEILRNIIAERVLGLPRSR